MERYERLIAIVDAFIGTFDGALRIQDIQMLLLVQKASRFGSGIKPSELQRLTGAPLETIRRRLLSFKDLGLIDYTSDPTDDRATLFTMTRAGQRRWPAADIVRRLHPLRPQQPDPGATHPLGPDTYDRLVAILQACGDAFDGSMRIRGLKTALLIQQATVLDRGITASTLSRQTSTPLETVRRHLVKHAGLGDLKIVEDPQDERAARVFTAHPERERQTFQTVTERLDALDWNIFNLP